jgi:uncharacterized protein YbjT (DUF2867 family)
MQNQLAMVRDGAIYTAAGDGRVAMVDARDVATVAVAALTGDGHEGKIGMLAAGYEDVVTDVCVPSPAAHRAHFSVLRDTGCF